MGLRPSTAVHHRSWRALAAVHAAASAAALLLPDRAPAVIHPAAVLDGPSNAVLDVDGAAMAPDGSGGVVYRKQVEGVAHVFAVPFQDGRWGAPVEVDGEDAYGASEPAIAAGEGGRLLVVWVQPRNVSPANIVEYELMGASLQPGASAFGQAIAVDPSVGEPRTGDAGAVDPRLAMAPDGAAYVVYRVVLDDCALGDEGNPEEARCRPRSTDKVVSVRVARFDYLTWSSLGQVNRAPQIAMRNPTPENAPSVGIALDGNGVVAWQEPDASGAARIWARRLFGTVRGNVLPASPETFGGGAVTSDADAPSVAVGPYGDAQIAYRVRGAPGTAVPTTRLFADSLLSETAPGGSRLQGATAIAGAAQDGLGAPSAAVDQREDFRVAWTQGGAARELAGGHGTSESSTLGSGAGAAPTAINPAGGGTTAFASPGGPAAVQVREDYAQGAFQTAQLAGDVPGPVAGLSLGGDGQGDALLGFAQGPVGRSEVLGAFAQAPPSPFVLDVPFGWVRARSAAIGWEGAFDAVAGIAYTVYVDGRPRARTTGLGARLSAAGLGDGVHRVQVLATDASGQRTMSARGELKVDANPPVVRVALIDHGVGVRVTVRDAASGVDAGATRVRFGDGSGANRRRTVSHRYRRAGLYTITAQVRDRVGNRAVVRMRVRVR
jgi:hypothetical protein